MFRVRWSDPALAALADFWARANSELRAAITTAVAHLSSGAGWSDGLRAARLVDSAR